MNYAVRFLDPHPVEGHNSDWPCELQPLGDGTELPAGDGWALMTSEDYQAYLASHSQWDSAYLIAAKRSKIHNAIDARTRDLIARGFDFEGRTFSLSIQAQQNLQIIQLTLMIGSIGDVPYPTLDNQEYLLLRTKMPAFIETAFATLNSRLLAGTTLKSEVNAMTTLEQLNDFVDPRI